MEYAGILSDDSNISSMENISILVIILFVLTTGVTVWLFFKAANYLIKPMVIISGWIILQSVLGISGFYRNWEAVPPRIILLIVPAILCIIIMFLTNKGRAFVDSLDIKTLTILHTIRIPVEITLYYAYLARLIPGSMTFEGSNFDIISGVSAPVIYYLVFILKKTNGKTLLVWNFLCLGLLLNVVVTAILSAKTPFQQFAFDQPNIVITYFPFVILPSVIVPIVLFSHLAGIRQLAKQLKATPQLA